MKFKIYTTRNRYRQIWTQELRDLGFKFEDTGPKWEKAYEGETDLIGYMIIHPMDIEINSLEELINIQSKVGNLIIMGDSQIEIYNDHHS